MLITLSSDLLITIDAKLDCFFVSILAWLVGTFEIPLARFFKAAVSF